MRSDESQGEDSRRPTREEGANPEPGSESDLAFARLLALVDELKTQAAEREAIFDAVGDAIFVLDAEQRIRQYNRAARRLFGVGGEELVGRPCAELVHGAGPPSECPILRMRRSLRRETADLAVGGRWYQVVADPILDSEGRLTGAVHVMSDITERRRMAAAVRSSEAYIKAVLDSVNDAVFVADAGTGEILDADQRCCEMFGYSREELLRTPIGELSQGEPPYSQSEALTWLAKTHEEGPQLFEWLARRKDGSLFWVEVSTRFVALGGEHRLVVAVRDISQRKQAEQELRALWARQEALLAAVPNIIMEVDTRGVYTWANQAGLEFFGEGVIGRRADEYFVGAQDTLQVVQPLFDGSQELMYVESWQRNRAGEERLLGWWCRSLKDEQGRVTGALSSALDLTERVRAERALRRLEELHASIVQDITEGVMLTDRDGRIVFANQALADMLGYPQEGLLGRSWLEFVPPDQLAIAQEADARRAAGASDRYELALLRRDGSRLVALVGGRPRFDPETGRFAGSLAVITDITERKQAEEKRRQSEETYRNLFANAQVGLFRTRISDGKILECNEQLARMFGYKNREELIADYTTSKNYVDPGTREQMLALLRRDGFIENFEARFYRKDRSIVWVRYSARIYPERGWIEGVAEDITAVKEASEKLRQSEERFRRLTENASDLIYRYEFVPVRRFAYISPAATAFTGYTPEEHYADPDLGFKLIHPEDRHLFEEVTRGVVTFGKSLILRWVRRDGTVLWTEQRLVPIWDEEGNLLAIEGIARDISEQRRAEEERARLQQQLLQAQKLESIGRLAGGVAHDFNNMLNVIMGYGELMLYQLPKDDPIRKKAEEIVKAARRSADLTRQLLAFSRKQTLQPQVLDLNEHLRNLEKMLRRIIGEDIELHLVLAEGLPPVLFDPGQLDQVVINLAVNARDAMPSGGSLLIETSLALRDEGYAATHVGMTAGTYVLLAVTDTGCGMDKETAARAFEPFFTTKERGKGTGLGLSTVYGIVKQSNGHIWLYSEPGKGTTFKIYLHPSTTTLPVQPEAVAAQPPVGGEHILVVEDDESMRGLTKDLLLRLGYRVTLAANAGEALVLVDESGLEPDLVLTDVVMPTMNGKQLVERLRRRKPHLRVLFMSGYTDNAIVHHGVLDADTPFIQKPFSLEELGKKLREVLSMPHP